MRDPQADTLRVRRGACHGFAWIFALLALALIPFEVSAQGHRVESGGYDGRGTVTAVPGFGAPGTQFKLVTENLPADTTVQIMMGALRSGFEVIVKGATDRRGKIGGQDTLTVTVPEWTERDRPYLIMVSDTFYHPLAAADMFHPTDTQGMLRRSGTIEGLEPACATLQGEADELYFLFGAITGLALGDRVTVEGKPTAPNGDCGPGGTIEVTKVERQDR